MKRSWKIDLVAVASGAALAGGLIAFPRQQENARLADAGYDVIGKEWARYTPEIGSGRAALSDVLGATELPQFADVVWVKRDKLSRDPIFEKIGIKGDAGTAFKRDSPWRNPLLDSVYLKSGETFWIQEYSRSTCNPPYTEWRSSRVSMSEFEENLKRHWGIEVEFQDGMEMIGNDLGFDFNHDIDLAFRPSAPAWGALRAQVNKLVPRGYRESWERQNNRFFNTGEAATILGKQLAQGSPCWGLSDGKAYGSLAIDIGSGWCFYAFEYDD